MAKSKPKPLSFSTTIRNPARIPKFLRCIAPFEGMKLTSSIIHRIVKNVIREKEYCTLYIKGTPHLKDVYESDEIKFTDAQLEEIIVNSVQNHKEAGFQKGWDSRFDTWYKLIKEFGFIKYSMGQQICITSTGHMLLDALTENPPNEKKIQSIYLNALMKYQTNNPLRKNSNENAPLPLLLNVIQLFHDDPEENDAGLHKSELPILICWTNNNPDEVYECIKAIRHKFGFKASDEYIYDKCLEILGNTKKKYLKLDKICYEAVDEYIRKMRMSGLLSLRGGGRFLDINTYEKERAAYVAKEYLSYPKFDNEEDYISYLGTIDTAIMQDEKETEEDHSDIRKKTLKQFAGNMEEDDVIKELKKVCEKKESKDKILRYINGPTRLEFLVSVFLMQQFEGLDVNPNYAVDDEGLPVSVASGGCADIECYDDDYDSYFEVTLMRGSRQQVNDEIIPISRHLRGYIKNKRVESFSVFIAPTIHEDTVEACDWQGYKYKITILPFSIYDFLRTAKTKTKASELLEYKTENIKLSS